MKGIVRGFFGIIYQASRKGQNFTTCHLFFFWYVLCQKAVILPEASGSCEDKPVILYEYTRTRSGDHAKEFLAGFKSFHVSDAYEGYDKVEGITRCLCFSHLRRYYLDAIPLDSGKKEIPGSGGAIGRAYCDKLFKLEKKWKELTP